MIVAYKYVTSHSSTKEKALSQLAEVKKKFPEAFVVEVEGKIVKRAK